MNLADVFHKAKELIAHIRTRKKRRLYTQWVERAQLPPQAIPQEILGVGITGRKVEKSGGFSR